MTLGFDPPPPTPVIPGLDRIAHTRLRRRMLYGSWRPDLEQRLGREIGHIRKEAWGEVDLSANLFRASMVQLATLYHRPVTVIGDDELAGIAAQAGLWQLMDRVQRDTLGLREMFVRVSVAGEGALNYQPVYPDMVLASAPAATPDRPTVVKVLTLLEGAREWGWEVFDVSNPDRPVHRVVDHEGQRDLSAMALRARGGSRAPDGGLVGDAYPWRYRDGTPFIPLTLYHGAKTGMLFDPLEAVELVDGTFTVAVLWTFFKHLLKNCSWSQRWAMGVEFGADIEGGEQATRRGVVADPATVLMGRPDESFAGQPQIGQWSPTTDPMAMQEAVAMYERRLAAFAGISPSDIQRVAGDPRSGYALAITREGQREAQAKFEPQFRVGDLELLAMSAAVLNQDQGGTLAETGHEIVYSALPLSRDEQQAIIEQLNAGLLDRVTAYQKLNPGISRDAAQKAVEEIRRTNAQLA